METDAAGGPSRLTLTEEAVERLGLETAPVQRHRRAPDDPVRRASSTTPTAATWTFVELEPGVYQRAPITIAVDVDGRQGPAHAAARQPGTEVVTVGAAELVGVEAGISGGE